MDNALELRNLTKTFGDFTLGPLNLTLPSGCVMGLIGENGAGKSTTMKLILDMLHPDAGSVHILGQDNQAGIKALKEDVGVVLDEVGLSQCFTPRQVGKIMGGTFRNWDDAVYQDYLRRFSLPENKRFKEFSRGMKMKLGIAVALSHHAKLLLLDEATSGLDPVVRDEVVDLLGEFTRDEDHAVLLSSHIVSDLEKICDYIAFLHRGKLLLCEEKDLLKERYGVLHCTRPALAELTPSAVVGKRESLYGVEAIVERAKAPAGLELGPVDIEQLFIVMAKGEL